MENSTYVGIFETDGEAELNKRSCRIEDKHIRGNSVSLPIRKICVA